MFVQTCSKNWAMTGWRIGWLECNAALGQTVENLLQYSSLGRRQPSSSARPSWRSSRARSSSPHQIDKAERSRDILCPSLRATGRVRFAQPAGAFYLFFSVDGEPDTRRFAFRLVDEALVGLAPGTAFGPGGESYMRLCFARSPSETRGSCEANCLRHERLNCNLEGCTDGVRHAH